jgi:hypothetical protein
MPAACTSLAAVNARSYHKPHLWKAPSRSCACIPRWCMASSRLRCPLGGEPMVGRVFSAQFALCPSCRAQSTDLRGANYRQVFRSRLGPLDLRRPKGSQGKAYGRSAKYYPMAGKDWNLGIDSEYGAPGKIPKQGAKLCNRYRSVISRSVASDKVALKLRSMRCRHDSRLRAKYFYISSRLVIAPSA